MGFSFPLVFAVNMKDPEYNADITFFFAVSVESCRRNIKFNGSVAIAKVESHLVDARVYMLTHPKEFDVVCILVVSGSYFATQFCVKLRGEVQLKFFLLF